MPSIHERRGRTGKVTYQVRWRVNGEQRSFTVPTKAMARQVKAQVMLKGDLDYGPVESDDDAPTFAEWAAHHIAHLTGVSDRTRDDYRRQVDLHMSTLADAPIGTITRDAVRRWVLERAVLVSGKTLKNLHGLLHGILAGAVEAGHLDANPARGVRLPRADDHERTEMAFLTHGEFWLIADQLPEHWRAYFVLLAGTGLRLGELMGLRVGDIDLDGATPVVHVTKSLRYTRGRGFELGPTKTRKSRRTIALDPVALTELRPHLSRPTDQALVVQPNGKPVYPTNLYARIWRPAVEAAQRCAEHKDAPKPCGCDGTLTKNPRIHDLRHTHASWLIAQGVPLPVIQSRLGHENITTTIDRYGHLLPDLHVQAAAATARALERPVALPKG